MRKDERYFSNIETDDEPDTISQEEIELEPENFPLVMRFTIIDSKYGNTAERGRIKDEVERIVKKFRIALDSYSFVAEYSKINELSESSESLCFEIGVRFIKERFMYAYCLIIDLENFVEDKKIVFLDSSMTGKLPESNTEIPEAKLYIGYAEKKLLTERRYAKTADSRIYSRKILNYTELHAYDELIRSVSNHSDIPLDRIIGEINSMFFKKFDILDQFLTETRFKKENGEAFEINLSLPENAAVAEEIRQIKLPPGFIYETYVRIIADVKTYQERKIMMTTGREYVIPNYGKEPLRWFCTIESILGVEMFKMFGYFGTQYFSNRAYGVFTSAVVLQVKLHDSKSWKSLNNLFPALKNFKELKKFAKKFQKEHFEPEYVEYVKD